MTRPHSGAASSALRLLYPWVNERSGEQREGAH